LAAKNIGLADAPMAIHPSPYIASLENGLIVLYIIYPFSSFCYIYFGYIF